MNASATVVAGGDDQAAMAAVCRCGGIPLRRYAAAAVCRCGGVPHRPDLAWQCSAVRRRGV